MPESLVEDVTIHEELLKRVKEGKCILFLGAGVHAPPSEESPFRYPQPHRPLLGYQLGEKLASECRYHEKFPEDSSVDLQRVSLCYETTPGLGRSSLVDSLDRYVRDGKKPSPALKMLSAMPFKIIVTTNYDRLLESALIKLDKDPSVVIYNPSPDKPTPDTNDDPTVVQPLVFKMHGDLTQRESIVITDEDYITFVQRMSDKDRFHPVPETIRYRMQRWPTLFVGYSLRDYNLRLLFRTLRWRVDHANIPPSFSIDKYPDPLILDVWQNERRFITFLTEDLWSFVPWLYREVMEKDYDDG